MKKRLVAVMLGLTLSLATVGEAGAAASVASGQRDGSGRRQKQKIQMCFPAGEGMSRMLRQMTLTTYRLSSALMQRMSYLLEQPELL